MSFLSILEADMTFNFYIFTIFILDYLYLYLIMKATSIF
jgi:hypothetical protein